MRGRFGFTRIEQSNNKNTKIMDIALYDKFQDPMQAAQSMGLAFAKSGMFGVGNVESGTVLALACMTERRTPFDMIRTYDIVDGKLRKKALACLAEFRSRGGKHKWIKTGDDGIAAEAEFTFEGSTHVVTFTIAQAKLQGLVREKSNWIKTPGNMLRSRVISNAIGMLCPEIVAGMTDSDDQSEAPEAKPLFRVPKTETEAAKPAPEPAINVDSEIVPTPAPAATPEPEKKPELFVITADPATGRLTPESVDALQTAIGEPNALAALTWLKNRQWITGNLSELSVQRAQKILNKVDAFLAQCKPA